MPESRDTLSDRSDGNGDKKSLVRLLVASTSGNTIEFYDFFLYASATALVFGKVFFPSDDPLTSVFLAFSVYAVGFLSRPLGGVIFGHIGDRYGRRTALVWTLLLMGASTFAIGLVPPYAQIGAVAPALLVAIRLIQGIALGGEWAGAVILVAEHVSDKKRGLWTSIPQIGAPLGNLISAGVLFLLGAIMSNASFEAWGWRVAFFLSAILVCIGLYTRLRIDETPLFKQNQKDSGHRRKKLPLAEVLKNYKRETLVVMFYRIGENTVYYIFTIFLIVYTTDILHLPKGVALAAIMVGSVVQALAFIAGGAWSDRIGRKKTILLGMVGLVVWSFLYYFMVNTKSTGLIILAVCVGVALHGLIVGPAAAFVLELFGTDVRFSGASVGYQIGGVLGGAIAPLIAIKLLQNYHSWVPVAWYLAGVCVLAGISVMFGTEGRGKSFEEIDAAHKPGD
ncbi:MAG: MFS transporter [Pusillimonas sp.]|nr:MAG: MFS transporter [Pusillimonas sp.]